MLDCVLQSFDEYNFVVCILTMKQLWRFILLPFLFFKRSRCVPRMSNSRDLWFVFILNNFRVWLLRTRRQGTCKVSPYFPITRHIIPGLINEYQVFSRPIFSTWCRDVQDGSSRSVRRRGSALNKRGTKLYCRIKIRTIAFAWGNRKLVSVVTDHWVLLAVQLDGFCVPRVGMSQWRNRMILVRTIKKLKFRFEGKRREKSSLSVIYLKYRSSDISRRHFNGKTMLDSTKPNLMLHQLTF